MVLSCLNGMITNKYGWGYRIGGMTVGFGGLMTQAVDLAMDSAWFVGAIWDYAIQSGLGNISKEERDKELGKVFKKAASLIGTYSRKQIVGLDYAINIAEGLLGKDHKELQLLRMALSEFSDYDNFESLPSSEKRSWWQLVQKLLGGTGHTPEQAVEWEEMRGNPSLRKRASRQRRRRTSTKSDDARRLMY